MKRLSIRGSKKNTLACKVLSTPVMEVVTVILPAIGEYLIQVLNYKGRLQKQESIRTYTMLHNIYMDKFPPGDYKIRITELSSHKQAEYLVVKE